MTRPMKKDPLLKSLSVDSRKLAAAIRLAKIKAFLDSRIEHIKRQDPTDPVYHFEIICIEAELNGMRKVADVMECDAEAKVLLKIIDMAYAQIKKLRAEAAQDQVA